MEAWIEYEKAVACVVRQGLHQPELLVFRHPSGNVQVPKGTLEFGEAPEVAVLRELQEESGISALRRASKIAELLIPKVENASPTSRQRVHRWHVFRLEPAIVLPERWQHRATGSQEEEGLTFDFFWIPLADAGQVVQADFVEVCRLLLSHA